MQRNTEAKGKRRVLDKNIHDNGEILKPKAEGYNND